MLRLDEDLSPLYARLAEDPALAWASQGAGRWMRSQSVFEDVVKTICTTNCAWSGTVRMVSTLVQRLARSRTRPARVSDGRADGCEARALVPRCRTRRLPRGVLRSLARSVAAGELDLEALAADHELDDHEVAARLLELPGVGPYAAAHIMM